VLKVLLFITVLLFSKNLYSETNTVSSTVVTNSTPPTASAPSVVMNNSDICKVSASAAVQTQILGIAGAKVVDDELCALLKISKNLYMSGMKVAAVSTLCQDPRAWDAMLMAGTPCPYFGAIGGEAEEGWKANMDLIPEGSVIYAKWNDELVKIKVQEGVESDGSKFIKFVIGAMVLHSGIVMFFP
jgi:hypothetical protein